MMLQLLQILIVKPTKANVEGQDVKTVVNQMQRGREPALVMAELIIGCVNNCGFSIAIHVICETHDCSGAWVIYNMIVNKLL